MPNLSLTINTALLPNGELSVTLTGEAAQDPVKAAQVLALGLDVVAQNMQAAMEQLGKQKPRIVPATGLPS
jgi:signal transduction protein with GAF and PtsI domain